MAATVETPVQAVSIFQEIRAIFYVLGPSESSFRSIKEVPDYVDKVRAPNPTFLNAPPPFCATNCYTCVDCRAWRTQLVCECVGENGTLKNHF